MKTMLAEMLEMFLDVLSLRTALEVATLVAAYRLPRPNPTALEIRCNRILVKAVGEQ